MAVVIEHIQPRWYRQKAQIQSDLWRELTADHLPRHIADAITPDYALQLTRRHAEKPNQMTLVAIEYRDNDGTAPAADSIRDTGRVIGFTEVLCTPRPPINHPGAAELAALYVLTSRHRRGTGRALVEAAIQAIDNPRLALWTPDWNSNAIAFYEHIGFHRTGRTQTEDDGANREIELINF